MRATIKKILVEPSGCEIELDFNGLTSFLVVPTDHPLAHHALRQYGSVVNVVLNPTRQTAKHQTCEGANDTNAK